MSSSVFDVVRTTTGILFRLASLLISASTSRPSFTGRFRSSRIRPGRRDSRNSPCCRKYLSASAPSLTTLRLLWTLLSVSTSSVSRTSAALSSISKMSIGSATDSNFIGFPLLGLETRRIRNREIKRRASSWRRFHPDAPSVPLRDLLANCQSDPRARVLRLGVQPLKNHEYPLVVLLPDANSVITHGNLPACFVPLGADMDAWRLIAA